MSVAFFTAKVVEDILGNRAEASRPDILLTPEPSDAMQAAVEDAAPAPPTEETPQTAPAQIARVAFDAAFQARPGSKAQPLADLTAVREWGLDAGETTLPAATRMSTATGPAASADGAPAAAAYTYPTDDLFTSQWHLYQTTPGAFDLNVVDVWEPATYNSDGATYTGAGVEVAVIDDAVQRNHHQLGPNISLPKDHDFVNGDSDPSGVDGLNRGTSVAGIIGAVRDGTGVVGVAYDATLFGFQVHDSSTDDLIDDLTLAIGNAGGQVQTGGADRQADVANMSMGTASTNNYFDEALTASKMAALNAAIDAAAAAGRGGLGTVMVKAAGNWRALGLDANASSWNANIHTISVGSVGEDGVISAWSTPGANLLVSAFGAPGGAGAVVTTDRIGTEGETITDYTTTFAGTAPASGMVSGIVALMLEANPDLGWRDVQQILAYSARHVGSDVGSGIAGDESVPWFFNGAETWNGGGLHFSNDYGFGLVDALAAVRLAETWGTASKTTANTVVQSHDLLIGSFTLSGYGATDAFTATNTAMTVEHVEVTIDFDYWYDYRDLTLQMVAPDGTVVDLIRQIDDQHHSSVDAIDLVWTFTTPAFMGTEAAGDWTLRLKDFDSPTTSPIRVTDIDVTFKGSASSADDLFIFTNEYSDYVGLYGHGTHFAGGTGGATLNAAAVTQGADIVMQSGKGLIDGVNITFSAIDTVLTGDGNDIIRATAGAQMIDAGRGDDTVTMGEEALINGDVFYGGADTDTFDVSNFNWLVAVTIDLGNEYWGYSGNQEDVIGFEWLVGGNGVGETLIGSAGVNLIRGNGGDDTIHGLGDSDELRGGVGDDVLYGGADQDVLLGEDDNDLIHGGDSTDSLYGGEGNDTLDGGAFEDSVFGDGGDDRFLVTGTDWGDNTYGGSGIDTLDLSGWTNSAVAFDVNLANYNYAQSPNSLGQYGSYSIIDVENVVGSGFDDLITGDKSDNDLDGGDGNDTINGGDGVDTLRGGNGDDVLDAGEGENEEVYGGDGNDTLSFTEGEGFDNLDGGADTDLLTFYTTVGITIDLGAGDFGLTGVGGFAIENIENVTATGTGRTVMIGDGQENRLEGGDDRDTVLGGAGSDSLYGGDNIDSLDGGAGTDYLYGGQAGDFFTQTGSDAFDHIYGGDGADTVYFDTSRDIVLSLFSAIYGEAGGAFVDIDSVEYVLSGTGNDSLIGGDTDDVLDGGDGNDTINGALGQDSLNGGDGNDVLDGGSDQEVDILSGGDGKDRFSGKAGYALDDIYGGAGGDTLILTGPDGVAVDLETESWYFLPLASGPGPAVISSVEKVFGSDGGDIVFGDDANNIFTGELGNDTIFGGKGSDNIDGGDGDDVLHGENGGDSIKGGLGDDLISGGYGADTLKGSGGNDTLDYSADTDGVTIDLSTNFADGGQATGDVISTFENVLGGRKRDFLTGDNNDNFLKGDNGNDIIRGGGGNDELTGNNGFDKLNGGEGNDTLTGGIQADQFLFDANFGDDEIKDFEVGIDVVKIFGGYTSADISLANVGTSVIATLDPTGDTIKFKGLQDTDINSFADFIFL